MKYFRSKRLSPIIVSQDIEIVDAESILDAKTKLADIIDLSYSDYLEVNQLFNVSNLDAYYIGAADCLILLDNKYQFYQLSQKAFLNYLSSLKINLRTDLFVVIVGDQLTLSQFLPALTKLGYSNFIFVVENSEIVKSFVEKILKTYLGIQIETLNFKQVSNIENASSLLLVDIDHQKHHALVESLTYFNFLTAGSLFFDVRSAQTNSLVQEAERAQMFIVDTAQYDHDRLQLADQILTKNIK